MKDGVAKGLDQREYRIISASDMRFPPHLHRAYEVMAVLRGNARTMIDGKELFLSEGNCAVIFPLQRHSFEVEANSRIRIFIFSSDLIPEFSARMQGRLPLHPVLSLPPELFPEKKPADIFEAKALFYRLCGEIAAALPITGGAPRPQPTAIDHLLLYIDRHFASDCSLKTVSERLRYDYSYLSKRFKEQTGISYNRYVSQIRVNRACHLLSAGNITVTEAAAAVGFNSIRTFNRVFLKQVGVVPREYKKAPPIPAEPLAADRNGPPFPT